MPEYKSYSLQGGQPVKISPFEATEAGTFFAGEGCAFNPVIVTGGSGSTAELVTYPPAPDVGVFIFAAYDNQGAYASAMAEVAFDEEQRPGFVISLGDGILSIDFILDEFTVAWTPTITPDESGIKSWFIPNLHLPLPSDWE